MATLSLLFIINLILIGNTFYKSLIKGISVEKHRAVLMTIKFIGGFALSFGIFAQTISLIQAFGAIERAGEISQAILAGGLKVSMYTTIYGFLIFLFSQLSWMLLKRRYLIANLGK